MKAKMDFILKDKEYEEMKTYIKKFHHTPRLVIVASSNKAICKCHICDKEIEVDFVLKPTEEDKLGFYCKECEEEHKDN